MSKLDAHCQSRAWDSLRALNIQLLALSFVLGCIFFIKLAWATNRVRELSWARGSALVRERARLIARPVYDLLCSFEQQWDDKSMNLIPAYFSLIPYCLFL